MRKVIAPYAGKLILFLTAAMPLVCHTTRAPAAEPGDSGRPTAFVVTADEAALNAILDKIRLRNQGGGQPEVIPAGVNATATPDSPPTGGDLAAAGGEPWRCQWFAGRWWYWMPDRHWMWWDAQNGWLDFHPALSLEPAPPYSADYAYYPGCYGYPPVQVFVGPQAVTVSAGPVYVGVGGGHVGVSVFGFSFGF